MVAHILIAGQLPCNKISNDEVSSETYTGEPNNELPDTETGAVVVDESYDRHTGVRYLSFHSAQKIIHKLLTYDRIVLLPNTIPKITELELAKELNISTAQLWYLQESLEFYKKMAKHICLPLANLYCRSTLQQPESLHTTEVCYE
jgi:hypothetical protein